MGLLINFDGYRLRSISEEDYARLEEWIAADPHHRGILDPEFFMGQAVDAQGKIAEDPRTTCYVLENSEGPLFYVRLSRAARVNIQFAPPQAAKRSDVREGLLKGMAMLEVGLERAGAEEWIFESTSPELRLMATRRLGFVESPDEMVRVIPRLKPQEAACETVRREQRHLQEGS